MEGYKPPREEIARAESMMSDDQRAQSEAREQEFRKEHFTKALDSVCERYPSLADKIRLSLDTPQIGAHHNEGPRMDAHLSLILATLESIAEGQFPEAVGDMELQRFLREVVVVQDLEGANSSHINPRLVEYTFLHDISKPDCLTLKVEGEKKGIEVTWDEWVEIERQGEPYTIEGKPVSSVSYFHSSEGTEGQHGNKAATLLGSADVAPEIIAAIRKHEVAYQFGKINAATYEEHFVKSGFTDTEQKFILAASYIDTMASLGPDGTPDLGNFMNLLASRNNYLLVKQYVDQGILFRENDLAAIKKQDRVLTAADLERIIPRKERYNLTQFGTLLDTLVAGGHISEGEKSEILAIVTAEPQELGKKFGAKMRFIKPLLEQTKE